MNFRAFLAPSIVNGQLSMADGHPAERRILNVSPHGRPGKGSPVGSPSYNKVVPNIPF